MFENIHHSNPLNITVKIPLTRGIVDKVLENYDLSNSKKENLLLLLAVFALYNYLNDQNLKPCQEPLD